MGHIYSQKQNVDAVLSSSPFQILLEKFMNLGEWCFLFVQTFQLRRSNVEYFPRLTGDDRNIVEVFVAGRKVIPFAEA